MNEERPINEAHEPSEGLSSSFDTRIFGVETKNPVIKSLDWLEKHRSDAHILKSARNMLTNGIRSRRERFTELGGHILSGYYREPQSEIHVHIPTLSPDDITPDSRENWQRFFKAETNASKSGYRHKAYVLFDAPVVQRDTYKNRNDVVPDSVAQEKRLPKAFLVRAKLLRSDTLKDLCEAAARKEIPVIDMETLSRIP